MNSRVENTNRGWACTNLQGQPDLPPRLQAKPIQHEAVRWRCCGPLWFRRVLATCKRNILWELFVREIQVLSGQSTRFTDTWHLWSQPPHYHPGHLLLLCPGEPSATPIMHTSVCLWKAGLFSPPRPSICLLSWIFYKSHVIILKMSSIDNMFSNTYNFTLLF